RSPPGSTASRRPRSPARAAARSTGTPSPGRRRNPPTGRSRSPRPRATASPGWETRASASRSPGRRARESGAARRPAGPAGRRAENLPQRPPRRPEAGTSGARRRLLRELLAQHRQVLLTRRHHAGSELVPAAAPELGDRVAGASGGAIDAVRGHRIEGVGHQDDPRAQRDVLTGQPQRIAGAVPPLVVVPDPAIDRRDAQTLQQPVS